MNFVRKTAVAGSFYPSNEPQLRSMLAEFLQHAATPDIDPQHPPKAIIAPHAGYIYSGSVAANAYAYLGRCAEQITRVVLLGPSHRVPFLGFATSSADFFATPLGNIPIDRATVEQLNQRPDVQEMDAAHALEHSLEVHLPFLQMVLRQFQLVPIVVGDASTLQVDSLLAQVWDGPQTFIVVSSDLSHFHDYHTAKKIDFQTTKAIEALNAGVIHSEQACGCVPVRGLLEHAKALHMRVKTVDCRNSGDTAGSHDRVVGYGAYVFNG